MAETERNANRLDPGGTMIRLGIAIAGLATLLGCSSSRDPDVAATVDGNRSFEVVPVESTGLTSLKESARPHPRPANRSKLAAAPAPRRTPVTGSHTDSVAAYAPDAVGADTGAAVIADTAAISAPDTVAPPASDTVATVDKDAATPQPQTAPAPTSGPIAARTGEAAGTLPVGTEIPAVLEDSLDSRHDSAGKVVMARITEDVRAPDAHILIPAGSQVQLTVTQLEPARSKSAVDGKVALRVDAIMIDDRLQRVSANVGSIPHELRGRGVTAGEAEKVGIGAAGGAVLGRVIGKNTRGAVIGGVIGAAGGAVVASQTASRDVVLRARTRFTFALTAPLLAER
jgi:glycine zipper 2TM protein